LTEGPRRHEYGREEAHRLTNEHVQYTIRRTAAAVANDPAVIAGMEAFRIVTYSFPKGGIEFPNAAAPQDSTSVWRCSPSPPLISATPSGVEPFGRAVALGQQPQRERQRDDSDRVVGSSKSTRLPPVATGCARWAP